MTYPCSVCYADATLACSGCKYQRYCSAECQKYDWKTHKKGCKMQQILNKFNDEHNAKPRGRPPTSCCTGCNVKFSEDDPCEDECPTCGYVACESCIADTSNGTCYCAGSNFGRNYCEMEPRWYHMDGNGKSYNGDRHPLDDYPEEVYESDPRACNNCGKVTKLFKKDYRRPTAY
ncbi:hypothetical protein K466DRAFT_538285 [Polyporus arcularius HHB13444]|uniref:MYND-type domain-containing protein n=1 Tax=Polyporus arcularius HHB13444 TaxID=1314778 RepID=A0A5C3PV09_9APHY|nr:hypothetical protein K466DRAFT_538285 [Polyporus arcularius HHB13444]